MSSRKSVLSAGDKPLNAERKDTMKEEITIMPTRDLLVMKAEKELLERGEEPKPYRVSKLTKITPTRVAASQERIKQFSRIKKFVKDAQKIGWYRLHLENRGVFRSHLSRGRETEKQMLRENLWPFWERVVPWWCILDKKTRTLIVDSSRAEKVKKFVECCAKGEVPMTVAKKLHIPPGRAYTILGTATCTGLIHRYGEDFPFKHIAVTDAETWRKAHELYESWRETWRLTGNKRKHAPFGTKWLGKDLVPDDPENKISRLVELRLRGYGTTAIAAELKVSNDQVYEALKRDRLYIDLGMVDPEQWKKAQGVHLNPSDGMKRIAAENRNKVLQLITSTEPAGISWSELKDRKLSSPTSLGTYLRTLRQRGEIESIDGKWHTKKA